MIKVLILFLLKQVKVGATLSITFENKDVCALTGSSAVFSCSYTYGVEESVRETSWLKGELKDGVWTRVKLSDLPSYRNRFEYFGDLQHNCSLVLRDVQDNDTGYYYFWFDTNMFGRNSRESVFLSVTELKASVSARRVTAGNNVTLQCTTCQIPNIVWFRDGRAVAKSEFQAQPEDAGKYSCAIKGHESVRSDAVSLDVWYSPVNVSVEVIRSGLLSEGSSVNLTCSSAARPAAQTYTWFRKTVSNSSSQLQVGSGQVLSLSSLEMSHTGIYVCQAKNSLGQNTSADVLLLVEEAHVSPFIVLGIGIKVLILLLLPLVIFWAWRRWRKSAADREVTRRRTSSGENGNVNHSHDYENVFIG